MKRGPFPMWPALPAPEYYDPLRLPLGRPAASRVRRLWAGIASRRPAGAGAETALPSSQDDHPHVQRPPRRRVPRRPLLDQGRLPWPSPWTNRLGSLSPTPNGRVRLTTLARASLALQTARSHPAPLRTRPLDHARGPRYRGPRRLPGPDSHRQAAPNLSLAMSCRTPFLHGTEQSRRTRPWREPYGGRYGRLLPCRGERNRVSF
jgi:hypothetical protein